MSLTAGTRLGPCEIQSALGAGGRARRSTTRCRSLRDSRRRTRAGRRPTIATARATFGSTTETDPVWSPDGTRLHATALFQTRISFALVARTNYAVAPDGRFLTTKSIGDTGVSPITLLLNWSGLR